MLEFLCPACRRRLHELIKSKNVIHLYCLNCSKENTEHWFFYCKDTLKILNLAQYKDKIIKEKEAML